MVILIPILFILDTDNFDINFPYSSKFYCYIKGNSAAWERWVAILRTQDQVEGSSAAEDEVTECGPVI